ncbi:MAG TPA: HepT-like ribonuclease domain-containing protein [Methylocella sp.]|nr:HepT-like ribonuclease domain-containing protein [Methylocella sp.]
MREAIARIETYTHGFTLDTFRANTLVQDAVYKNFENIGEAAANIDRLDKTFWERHPNVAFRDSYDTRNVFAHGYFAVNSMIVWNLIQNDLPAFKEGVEALLELYPSKDIDAEAYLRARLDAPRDKETKKGEEAEKASTPSKDRGQPRGGRDGR